MPQAHFMVIMPMAPMPAISAVPMVFQSTATLQTPPGLLWSKVRLSSSDGSHQVGIEQGSPISCSLQAVPTVPNAMVCWYRPVLALGLTFLSGSESCLPDHMYIVNV